MRESEAIIEKFLKKIKNIVENPEFDINRDFVMEERQNDTEINQYSNFYTMLSLDYNIEDIINELKSLTYENYLVTITDIVGNCTFLYVFLKEIIGKTIYIKFGTYQRSCEGPIICISFHFSDSSKEIE